MDTKKKKIIFFISGFLIALVLFATLGIISAEKDVFRISDAGNVITYKINNTGYILLNPDSESQTCASNISGAIYYNGSNFYTCNGASWTEIGGSSGGTVTSISQGTGLTFSANPLTTTGTISLNTNTLMANSTMSAKANWNDLTNMPAGFADGVDNAGTGVPNATISCTFTGTSTKVLNCSREDNSYYSATFTDIDTTLSEATVDSYANNNGYQMEISAWKIYNSSILPMYKNENFTSQYSLIAYFKNENYTSLVSASYKNENFTVQYDAITSRFNNGNFSSLTNGWDNNIGDDFNLANYSNIATFKNENFTTQNVNDQKEVSAWKLANDSAQGYQKESSAFKAENQTGTPAPYRNENLTVSTTGWDNSFADDFNLANYSLISIYKNENFTVQYDVLAYYKNINFTNQYDSITSRFGNGNLSSQTSGWDISITDDFNLVNYSLILVYRNENFTTQYNSLLVYKNENFTNQYNALPYYKNANFTSQYDAIVSRFGNANATILDNTAANAINTSLFTRLANGTVGWFTILNVSQNLTLDQGSVSFDATNNRFNLTSANMSIGGCAITWNGSALCICGC